jgi:arylsulfatase A-like enzyme
MRVLYVDIDTLRADHLGCYGYHRPTSPNIDRIAEQGVRLDRC